jgi:hypothetical protein
MRTCLTALLLGTLLVVAPSSQTTDSARPTDSLTRPFAAAGDVSMDLSAGEYRIEASPDNNIRVTWSTRYQEDLRDVRTRLDVRGREAALDIEGPSGDNHGTFRVTVAVPARSDLQVRLTAGELDIRGVTGNKNVSLHAGEVTIEVGNPRDYRRVEASVWAGEVSASPFGRRTEGLFRSIDWEGPGQYRLEAHLKAGEIRLR